MTLIEKKYIDHPARKMETIEDRKKYLFVPREMSLTEMRVHTSYMRFWCKNPCQKTRRSSAPPRIRKCKPRKPIRAGIVRRDIVMLLGISKNVCLIIWES